MPPPVPPSVKLGRMIAGQADLVAARGRLVHRATIARLRHVRRPILSIASRNSWRSFGLGDGFRVGADQLDAVARSRAPSSPARWSGVERGLAAHRRQARRRAAPSRDDLGHDLGRDRLDVGGVGQLGIGHDRGRVRVHQDDAIALLLQRLARLGARVVELARLADDDGPGADDEDGLDVGALGHHFRARSSR